VKPSTFVLVSAGIVLAVPGTASAYLDPGTGSMLLQGAIAFVAAVVAGVGMRWQAIKSWFLRRGHRHPGSTPPGPERG
jgi:hypothetical protein